MRLRQVFCSVMCLLVAGGWAAIAQAAPALPDGRAYEMVSPLDKNGGEVDRDFLKRVNGASQSGAAPSGDAVAFTSRLQFGTIESGAIAPTYVARRAGTGWVTEGVTPPIGNQDPQGTERPNALALSLDLSKAFVTTPVVLTSDASSLGGSWGLYLRRSGQQDRYGLLSMPWTILPPEVSSTDAALRFEYEADTPDSRHVIFNSTRKLLFEAPDDAGASPNAVYEWVDGTLRLASTLPPGMELSAGSVLAGSGPQRIRNGALHGDHVISDDGRRVFFTAPLQASDGTVFASQLMVREDGATTRVLSTSERPGDPPLAAGANPLFWSAKASDGSVAFFRNNTPLTPDAGTQSLYRWDGNAPAEPRLTELSQDPLGAPGVLGPAAVNDAATAVYFVATGVLDTSAPTVPRGAPNLYLWRQGEGVRHVATLDGPATPSSRDSMMWVLGTSRGGRAARVSADGERLLFASSAQLDPSYDVTETTPSACGSPTVGGQRCRQIYLYDAPSDSLTCITCVEGAPLSGDADLFGNSDNQQQQAPLRLPRNLSADGSRAFFETARPLHPSDNNSVLDVYEWRDADLDGNGELRLMSAGQGVSDSKFLDASPSGDNVFFTTRERLVGIDVDNQVDLYDARVGGGIAAQNPPPISPCEGDACQGSLSGAPLTPGVGSGQDSRGDLRPGARPVFSVTRLSRAQRARLARGLPVVMLVRVSRSGRVSIVARAKLGDRRVTVAKAAKAASKAGPVKLRLKLSAFARRQLARRAKLTLTLAVRFAGVREAKTSTMTLRPTRGSAGRRER